MQRVTGGRIRRYEWADAVGISGQIRQNAHFKPKMGMEGYQVEDLISSLAKGQVLHFRFFGIALGAVLIAAPTALILLGDDLMVMVMRGLPIPRLSGTTIRYVYVSAFLVTTIASTAYFHILIFSGIAERLIGLPRSQLVRTFDYIWYVFGAIVLSLAPLDDLQIRDPSRAVIAVEVVSHDLEFRYQNSIASAVLSCGAQESASASIVGLCEEISDLSAEPSQVVNACSAARIDQFFSYLPREAWDPPYRVDGEWIPHGVPAGCAELSATTCSALTFACEDARQWGSFINDYAEIEDEISNPHSISVSLEVFLLLAIFVGLKIAKTSSEVFVRKN